MQSHLMDDAPQDTDFETDVEQNRTLIYSPKSNKQTIKQSIKHHLLNHRIATLLTICVVLLFLIGSLRLFSQAINPSVSQSIPQPIKQFTQSISEKVSNTFYAASTSFEEDNELTINRLIDESLNQFIDPLPSCSIINQNVTRNMLHHQWMIQHKHVHSDCSAYPITGQCVYDTAVDAADRSINETINQSTNQESHAVSFTPNWLVFHINSGPGKKGTGGLADRLKGLYTAFGLSLLLGRAFALHVEDFVDFSSTFDRGVIEWIQHESIPVSVRNGKVHEINWQGIWDHRPLLDEPLHDWRAEWAPFDIVQIEYNMNGWSDFVDHRNLLDAARAFGFHTVTEKGDMDLYWECIMDALFTYTPAVHDVLNPLLQSINRPGLLNWQQRSKTIPTYDDIIQRQQIEERVRNFDNNKYQSLMSRSLDNSRLLYQAKFSFEHHVTHQTIQQEINQPINHSPIPYPLYCLQLRMGSNGAQQTNNQTIGFTDFEGFLKMDQLTTIFSLFESSISSHLSNHPSFDRSKATLFITSDSDAYLSSIPSSLSSAAMLVVPGRTAHIDKMDSLLQEPSIMLEAVIKTLITHYMLGECSVAAVTESGFGPTGLWRGRNRQHVEHPIEDQVWEDKFMIHRADAQMVPYVHMRGSAGREFDVEYREINRESRERIERSVLINSTLIEALKPNKHGKFQASAALDVQIPNDPACTIMKVFKM